MRVGHNVRVPLLPADEYRARLAARQATHAALTRSDERMSAARLTTFGIGVLLAVFVVRGAVSGWWLLVPIAALLLLIQWHDRIVRARDAASRAATFYRWGLARIADDWRAFGVPGDRFRDDDHPYANDLDLFGAGSLFQLLSIARTRAGEETLARWLKSSASRDDVLVRQAAVRELTPALDLRETVALAGEGARTAIDSDTLIAWAEHAPRLRPPHLRWLMRLLTVVTLATGTYWAFGRPAAPIVITLLAQSIVAMLMRPHIEQTLHSADAPARELRILLHIVERIEREPFTSPRLAGLAAAFTTRGVRASTAIRRLNRLIEMHDWEHNLVFTPIAAVVMWGTHIAWALEGSTGG